MLQHVLQITPIFIYYQSSKYYNAHNVSILTFKILFKTQIKF